MHELLTGAFDYLCSRQMSAVQKIIRLSRGTSNQYTCFCPGEYQKWLFRFRRLTSVLRYFEKHEFVQRSERFNNHDFVAVKRSCKMRLLFLVPAPRIQLALLRHLRWRVWREKFLQTPPSVRSFSCTSSAQKLNFFGRSRIFLPVQNVFCQDNLIGKGCGSRVNNSNDYNSHKNTDIENKLLILNSLKISG